jgi:trigger factor
LKIETQPLENHQVKLIVEVEPETFEVVKRHAARKIAKRVKIPGFRPGKAPYNVVQRFIGDSVIAEEGIEQLVDDIYPKMIEEAHIHPYGPGKLDNIIKLDPPILEFTIPLAAEVDLGDYHAIRFDYELKDVTEDDVNKVIEDLRRRNALDDPVARPSQIGDRVDFKISGIRTQPEEGKESTLIRERAHSIIINKEDNVDNWHYTNFSRELIGLSKGSEKVVPYTYPSDSEFTALRDVAVEFKVNIEEVKSHTLPELTDEFAHSAGDYQTVDELRIAVRADLEKQAREAYDSDYDELILNRIIEESTFKYPPQMIEEEIHDLIEQLENRLKGQNLDLPTYLKTRGIDHEGLHKEIQPSAENRIKRSLALMEISQNEKIELDKIEVQAEAERTLEAMSKFMSEKEIKKIPSENLFRGVINNVMVEMQSKKTLEHLRRIARNEIPVQESIEVVTEPILDSVAVDESIPLQITSDDNVPTETQTNPDDGGITPLSVLSETSVLPDTQ